MQDNSDSLYVVYWTDEQGYEDHVEFVSASTEETAVENSSYGSGGVAHQRLLFKGTFTEFEAFIREQLSGRDGQVFEITS